MMKTLIEKHKTPIWAVSSGVLGFVIAFMVHPLLEFKTKLEQKEIEIGWRTDGLRQLKYWKGYKNINARQFQVATGEWVLVWRSKSQSDKSVFSIEVLDGNDSRIAHVGYTTESSAGYEDFEEAGPVSLRINCVDQLFEVEVWAPPEK